MDRQLIRQIATLRHLDRVHLADQVSDRDVWCGQLLAVTILARNPADWRVIAKLIDALSTLQ